MTCSPAIFHGCCTCHDLLAGVFLCRSTCRNPAAGAPPPLIPVGKRLCQSFIPAATLTIMISPAPAFLSTRAHASIVLPVV